MAGSNYHAHPYIRDLNDYQARLSNCAELSAHLLIGAGDHAGEEWHLAACVLMSRMLLELVEGLPFPEADALSHDAEAAA